MRLITLRTLLPAAVWLAGLAGCRSDSERLPYRRDPLLVSRRPVEGIAGREPPVLLALAEPVPPALPPNAYVALPPASRVVPQPPALLAGAQSSQSAEPGKFPLGSRKPVAAMLVPRVKTSPLLQVIPVSRTRSPATYGRAPDFSWLQGVLERSKSGQWQLRYAELPEDDPWDGKVILEEDSRLAQLRSGDAVDVEGEMVSLPVDDSSLPVYRIRKILTLPR